MLHNTKRILSSKNYKLLWNVYDEIHGYNLMIDNQIKFGGRHLSGAYKYLQHVEDNLYSILMEINKTEIIKERNDDHKNT